MKNYNIELTQESLESIANAVINGSHKSNKALEKALRGLMMDDPEIRKAVVEGFMGHTPNHTKGIKPGDIVVVKKSKYFINDYDVEQNEIEGYIIPLTSSSYESHYVVGKVLSVVPESKSSTFELVYKLIDKNGKTVNSYETVASSYVKPFETLNDGKD